MAWIIARNAVPVAGMALLGWQGPQLVVLYYADTIASIAAVFALFFIHSKEWPGGHRISVKDGCGLAVAGVILTLVYAYVLAFPVIVMVGISVESFDFSDPQLLAGLAVQVAMALMSFLGMHRYLRGRPDRETLIRKRFQFVTLRWVVVFATSLVAPFAVVLVVAYAAASAYFELRPPPAE